MMELDFAHLSDFAYIDRATSKFYILGEFRYIRARSLPAQHGRMVLAFRLIADLVEVRDGKAKLQLEFTDADGNPIIPRSPEVDIKFGPIGEASPGRCMAQVTLEIQALPLAQWGDYSIHIFVNGIHVGRAPFTLLQPPQPPEQ